MSKSKNEMNLAEAGQEGEACLRAILNHAIEENAESVDMRLICEVASFTDAPIDEDNARRGLFSYSLRTCGETSEKYPQEAGKFLGCVRILDAISGGSASFVLRDKTGTLIHCRWAKVRVASGQHVSLRFLNPHAAPDLNSLGLDEDARRHIDRALASPDGLIIIAGPSGSGRSTTMSAMVRALPPSISRFNVEEEDQVLGGTTHLQQLMCADPDVIVISSIHDKASADLAIESAITGHLVFATTHAAETIDIPTRLMLLGTDRFYVGRALRLICSQRLVRILCQDCATPRQLTKDDIEKLFDSSSSDSIIALAKDCGVEIGAAIKERNPSGCQKCRGRGYSGRKAVIEVIPVNSEARECIAKGGDLGRLVSIMRRDNKIGKSLQEQGRRMLLGGETDLTSLRNVIDFTR